MEDKIELATRKAHELIEIIRKSAETAFEKGGFKPEEKPAFIHGWMECEFERALGAIYLGDAEWYRGWMDWRLSQKEEER